MKILIVEDDPVSALLLRRVLEGRGFEVERAENGSQAMEMVQERHHRVVISDWMMPEMDGVTLCRQFRQMQGAYVYMILLSAKSQRDDRLAAFEAGVDDFLTKPLDREELFARLKVAQRILRTEENLHLQKRELEAAGDRLQQANTNLMLASRRFEELFNGMPAACFTFDEAGRIHEWNREAETLFGIAPHRTLLQPVVSIFGARGSFWTPEVIEQVFKGRSLTDMEWVYESEDREARWLVCNVFPLVGTGGEILGAISANVDITERKLAERRVKEQMAEIASQKAALQEANERLALLALTDGLTGLCNHRRFQEILEEQFLRLRETEEPLSVVMLDVDHFKAYNDTYGHTEGDNVLKTVAQALTESCLEQEIVARYGGEEFSIVLANTGLSGAVQAAERFREAIAHQDWPLRKVTVSVGVATSDPSVTRPKQLIERADEALYASKQAGRNRVTSYESMWPGAAAA
ncbi:MAG TPA: diguanylate cyclase [Fimbriimonadaceae bacterium]|nr:diguanylate cyclase [Fimbriimonadaceae bacterium]